MYQAYKYLSILLILGLAPQSAGAQNTATYGLPVRIPVFLSAGYGELRPNHFHAGIDIKTQQVIGKPVHAVAGGYVVRVAVSPGGYGKALYIRHDNGTTSVYAHLEQFYDSLERYVYQQQYARKSYAVDLSFAPGRFPVTAGQQVALSGNRGSSGGPHLHFEIRDPAGRPLNVLAHGMLKVTDTIAPVPLTLYYVRLDTVQGMPRHRVMQRLPLRTVGPGRYAPAGGGPVEVASTGYFAIQAKEYQNGTTNVMGVYLLEERLDGEPVYGHKIDRIPFEVDRYSNAVTLYGEREDRNSIYRLFLLPNNPLGVYHSVRNRGLVAPGDSSRHEVEITLEDEAGNLSRVQFDILRKDRFDTLPAPTGLPVLWWKGAEYDIGALRVEIPPNALYESILLDPKAREVPIPSYAYSPLYDLHTADEPLQKSISLALSADSLPRELRGKALLGRVSPEGRREAAGGRWKEGAGGGRVEGRVSSFGAYYIAIDTLPPCITPEFKAGADLSGRKNLSLKISDNFSGIASYTATIDGQWALLEYDPKNDRITHPFDDAKWPRGSSHQLNVTVTDEKGNKSSFNATYKR